MNTNIVDLTIPFHRRPPLDDPQPYGITYVTPEQAFANLPNQGVPQRFFPDGRAWAVEEFNGLSTHAGTHVDFPLHYGGDKAITSDDIDLIFLLDKPGVCLDFATKARGGVISLDEMKQALYMIKHTLQPNEVVLIRTGASDYYDQPGYWLRHAGVSAAATRWLVEEHDIKLVGIDAWGWDQPFDTMAEVMTRRETPDGFWGAHKIGREFPYLQIENLANLHRLPSTGFHLSCVPMAIAHASAAWARVFARIPA